MNEDLSESAAPTRPLLHRLLHALAEAIGIFILGGGIFIVGAEFLCSNSNLCNDMGGIVVFIFSFSVTLIVCGNLVSLFAKFRSRLDVRKKLDVTVGVLAVFLWVLYFYRYA